MQGVPVRIYLFLAPSRLSALHPALRLGLFLFYLMENEFSATNPILMQGDCLELMKSIPDGSVDMVLCDLPYGTTACKWDSVIPFEPLWAAYRRVCKPNAAIVLTANFPFSATLTSSNLAAFRYCWVWEKSKPVGHLRAKLQPMRAHEDVLVFGFKSPRYYPQGLIPITPTLRKRTNTVS